VQQAAELSVAAPTIEAALDARFLSGAKDERVSASAIFEKAGLKPPTAAKVPPPSPNSLSEALQ
jgi:6-phosphogluconate dehydrogenase